MKMWQAILLAVVGTSVASCMTCKTPEKKVQKPQPGIYQETDTTDIFAIPLDNSQLEEQEEEQELEAMDKKLTAKRKLKNDAKDASKPAPKNPS